MSKPETSTHTDAPHVDAHGPIHALIEALHRLVIAVSERMRHVHVRDRKQMEHAKGNYDIWAKIGSHIEQVHVEEQPAKKPSIPKPAESARKPYQPSTSHVVRGKFGALSGYYSRKAIVENHPHMDKVLRDRTMEHISTALQLARRGHQDSAKLHINLAESAMHTASRFMDHDDYEDFERQVEQRLESLLEGTPYIRQAGEA